MCEFDLMPLVAFVASEDVDLHANLRSNIAALAPAKASSIGAVRMDMFQAVALMEVLHPVKFSIFASNKDLMEFNISDPFTFSSCDTNEVAILMQPVILTVIIASSNHVDRKVVNSKGGTGTWIKVKDELPQWIIAAASRCLDPGKGTVRAMIRDWKDGENCIFQFEKGSPQQVAFKLSKRGLFLQKLSKFSAVHASNLAANVSSSLFVTNPMSLVLEITLYDVQREVRNELDNEILMFLKRYREDSNLLGYQLLDK